MSAINEFLDMRGPPDHEQLVREMPRIGGLPTDQRLELARRRRQLQLNSATERELLLDAPRQRTHRLRFAPHVALLDAAGRGDALEVERLLQAGAHPDSHNDDGLTPLHQCAIDRNLEIVKLLLRYGADVNATDTELWTPLHAAACCGYRDIVEVLINHGADLLAVNAEGNMPYDICDDAEAETLDLIETSMANRGITQEGINDRRNLPEKLMLDDMKRLHREGQPLDARMPDGSTYLHVAAAHGYCTVAAFLLRCGVSSTVRDNDLWMPIHAAASWNQSDLIEMLCDYNADINAKTATGETPLDLANEETTKQVIYQAQQQQMRKKRLAFGVRDSRRQSRKRKKFESPQQPPSPTFQVENPFSARGAIRRQSLRERAGGPLSRREAQNEQSNLMRSWSKDDLTNVRDEVGNVPQRAQSLSDTGRQRDSPNKRLHKSSMNKNKPAADNEWVRHLEANGNEEDEAACSSGGGFQSGHTRGSTVRKKKRGGQEVFEMNSPSPTSTTALNGKSTGIYANSEKNCCCCCTII